MSVLLLMIYGCSTTSKIPPGLLQECDNALPLLQGGKKSDIMLWKVESDRVYSICRDGKKRLIEAVK